MGSDLERLDDALAAVGEGGSLGSDEVLAIRGALAELKALRMSVAKVVDEAAYLDNFRGQGGITGYLLEDSEAVRAMFDR